MKTKLQRLFFTLIFTFGGITLAFGAGTIKGNVTDTEGNPLAFANIVITHKIVNGQEEALRSQIGTVSDLNGDYALTAVPEGTFKLEVIYLGYQSNSVIIEVSGNNTYTHDLQLENKTMDLEEVVVTMQAKGQMAAINQQLASIAIKNVVAADRIQRNPDANAAESIGRLPGVSVTRSGGEANDVIIRGMDSQYNTVLLNGVEIPSNKGTSRNASLGGISQFSLQGVEVYKSITADMDANTVSGAVNMRLKTAASGFHGSIMAQSGYNAQNKDFGNYKFNANLSNRFFEDKLGIDLNASVERVNRSTDKLSAGYGIETNDAPIGEYEPMYLNSINLSDVSNIKNRASGSLVFDYRFSPRSKIEFSNFFSSNPSNGSSMSKSFNPVSGNVGYGANLNTGSENYLYTGSILGEHVLGIFHIDYGLAYSASNRYDENRSFGVSNPNGYDQGTGTRSFRSLPLEDVILTANDEETQSNLRDFGMGGPGSWTTDKLNEKQYDVRLNVKVPVRIGDVITGNVKVGGQYKFKDRSRDKDRYSGASPNWYKLITGSATTPDGIDWVVPWVILNERNAISMENMVGGQNTDFLGGAYDFGWYPDISMMNEVQQWWRDITEYYRPQGANVYQPIFGQLRMMGKIDPRPSVMNDNTLKENYFATYLMGEFNIGRMVSFIPGVRYENVHDDLSGWFVERVIDESINIPGYEQYATRENQFLLPMLHLKFKPADWIHTQISYTETLFRPNYNLVVPFEYVDDALLPFQYEAGVPDLKPEEWQNWDVMVAFHSNKIGLLSINGFYKTVDHKIWRRNWNRIIGDPVVPHFPADAEVEVTSWYNHDEPTYVRGIEIEWQTNFWYLPKPFSYFTLTTNYSYINNEAVYPYSEVSIIQTGVSDRGRPLFEKVRSDSTYSGSMLNQPKHLVNLSLGFSYKEFDIWVSYQYIGEITTAKAVQEEKDKYKTAFQRWGVQGRWGTPLKGLEVLFNVANINNILEQQYYRGDSRPTNLEAYGWTADLGVRYIF